MLPLLPFLAAGIWGYNLYKFIELKSGNRPQRRNQDKEKNLDIFNHCTFNQEDKRVYNHYRFNNCVFNIYLTGGDKDEKHSKGKGSREFDWLSKVAEQER